jgi:hypothetical protein
MYTRVQAAVVRNNIFVACTVTEYFRGLYHNNELHSFKKFYLIGLPLIFLKN